VESLRRFDIAGKKSHKIVLPDLSPDLYPHFIRGFFDGDGSISIRKDGQPQFNMTSNSLFLEQCRAILATAGLNPNVRLGKRKRDGVEDVTCSLIYTGSGNTRKFGTYIYRDATVFLPRKFYK